MKRALFVAVASGILSFGLIGCAEKSTATKETKVTTPGGSTKVTEQVKTEKTGDHKDK